MRELIKLKAWMTRVVLSRRWKVFQWISRWFRILLIMGKPPVLEDTETISIQMNQSMILLPEKWCNLVLLIQG
jgi:hypothetical protein